MSVDIAWESFTSGEDGAALAENIRSFIHDKFQQIALPRFINTVNVHSFEFGSVSPQVEIKDVCDPLPDFYEDDDDDDDDVEDDQNISELAASSSSFPHPALSEAHLAHVTQNPSSETRGSISRPRGPETLSSTERLASLNLGALNLRNHGVESHSRANIGQLKTHGMGSLSTLNSPGIPGGTSNMSYFHFPVGRLSGAQTPLAAVASGTSLSPGPWINDPSNPFWRSSNVQSTTTTDHASGLRPRTAESLSTPEMGSPTFPASPQSHASAYPTAEKVSDDLTLEHISDPQTVQMQQSQPQDLQVVARVTYDGDVRMMLTAEILLDYPMPSFVSIPLKLSVTGVTFDGVALLAYIKKRMHFCFLDPEDARTMVEDSIDTVEDLPSKPKPGGKSTLGSLLREIHVESEIGRQESGKQVLKNVGKVEKFVLEQVRRIFEDEFVFPSFWTFLV